MQVKHYFSCKEALLTLQVLHRSYGIFELLVVRAYACPASFYIRSVCLYLRVSVTNTVVSGGSRRSIRRSGITLGTGGK